jgi:polyphosphate glucokinase
MAGNVFLGIDIGGSGVKGAPIRVTTGREVAERHRIETPKPATPDAVAEVVAQVAKHFDEGDQAVEGLSEAAVGVTFPGVVHGGVVATAANLGKEWKGVDADALFTAAVGRPVTVLNDADAAGLAEVRFGAGKGRKGVVLMLTFGTGIGSAFFLDGKLLPNTELGHLEMRGKDAEKRAASSVRDEKGWSYKRWAKAVDEYLHLVEGLFSPDLIIVGGGISKHADKWVPELTITTEIVPAVLLNEAGIVGAALQARTAR